MAVTHTFPIITRTGIINMKGRQVHNQCKQKGHEVYRYTLAILFSETVTLDENQFIIDHQHLDDAVQRVTIHSCEMMSREIISSIDKLLNSKKIPFLGMKLEIRPEYSIPDNGAKFRECFCIDRRDLPVINALF